MMFSNYPVKISSPIGIFRLIFFLLGPLVLVAQEHPNIILINADDLGWKDLGIYGSSFYRTPNIDRLGQSGILFTQAYAAAANCAPSRASMLTGLQTARHGIYTVGSSERGDQKDRKLIPVVNKTTLEDSFFILPEYLHDLGYHTITIGKWHLGEDPIGHGFDENVAGNRSGHPKTYFSPYQNRDLPDGPNGEFLTDRLTDEAIRFLRREHTRNFFLYLPYFAVHTPLMAKAAKIRKYEGIPAGPGQYHAIYAAMIESLDENIGRIIDALTELSLREKTLVIFTSDNGGICHISSQRPLRAGKGSYYEGGIRVPLIISWPGRIREGICDVPVTNLDLFPTIRDLMAGSKGVEQMLSDGMSILPLLEGDDYMPERPLFWHFPVYLEAYAGKGDEARDTLFRTRPGTVMRLGDWKLHEYYEDGTLELYHLGMDPTEQKNLGNIYPGMRDSLHLMMDNWRKTMRAPFPAQLNPYYEP